MTKYNGNINNILQGVSQQARRDRRPEQLGEQINCISSVTKGLGNRPGTQKKVGSNLIYDFDKAAKHTYDRGDSTERYTLVCKEDTIDVVDLLTGGTVPAITEETTYLEDASGEGLDPKDYLKFFTIADTTIVANTTVEPVMENNTDAVKWQTIIYCKKADYGLTYTVSVDGSIIATYNAPSTVTPGSGNVDKSIYLKTSDVMTALWTGGLSAWVAANSISGSYDTFDTIVLYDENDLTFVLDVDDGIGNKNLLAISTVTDHYEDLPAKCISGYKVKIVGEDEDVDNDYYTEFRHTKDLTDIELPPAVDGAIVDGDTSDESFQDSSLFPKKWEEIVTATVTGFPALTRYVQGDLELEGHSVKSVFGIPQPSTKTVDIWCRMEAWDGVEWLEGAYKKYTGVKESHGIIYAAPELTSVLDIEDTRIRIKYGRPYYSPPTVYYVSYLSNQVNYGIEGSLAEIINDGYWKECAGFDVAQSFDPTTMPHKITRVDTGVFELTPIDWIDRVAGDDDSNPQPSFINNMIRDIGLYQNRLLFASEENIIGSVTFDQFNLFAPSVRSTSDDDPIDTVSSDNQVTNLEHILVFNSALVVFSDKAQFIHTPDMAFTSSTFGLASKSRYSVDVQAKPVASASSIFFPYKFGEFTGVREYKIDLLSQAATAEAITNHVPEYIAGRAIQVISSTDYDILFIRTDADPKHIYTYQWFYQGSTRKQAAWHKWEFDEDIKYMEIIQDTLYVWYVNIDSELGDEYVTFLEIDLADSDSDNLSFPLRLDNYEEILATDAGDYWQVDRDQYTFGETDWDNVVVIGGVNSGIEGAKTGWTVKPTEDGVLIDKEFIPNPTGTPSFYLGVQYDASFEVTNPYVRDTQGKPKSGSRTTLKTMTFNCHDTGYLKVTVDKLSAATFTKEYNSKIVGSLDYLLNSQAPLQDVSIGVPIRSDASRCTVTVSSDSHLPFKVLDIDWLANYKEKGRRTI